MFKKFLASVGVGAAQVDTVLDRASLRPGDTLSGRVKLKGGAVSQAIEYVDLVLMAEVEVESGDHEHRAALPLARVRVGGAMNLSPGQTLELPFSYALPLETPVNNAAALASPGAPYAPRVNAAVWIHTDLAIASALDAKDRDFLDIHPVPQMQALIAAMASLGYMHASCDVEQGTARFNNIQSSLGCYQEFEFRPAHGMGGWNGIKEVEITCIPRPDALHVLIEVDRKFRGDSYRTLVMDARWQSINWAAELQRALA